MSTFKKLFVAASLVTVATFSFAGTSFAADNCSPCKSKRQNTAQKACASSFGGSSSDYSGAKCTQCKDTGYTHVTCWKDGQNKGTKVLKNVKAESVREDRRQMSTVPK